MTKYVQKPVGWWQDAKGRAQPPGSFLDASLRITSDSPSESADGQPAAGRLQRFIEAVRHRAA